jgi:hypothetical protein
MKEPGLFGKRLISGLRQGKYKITLEYIIVLESKNELKKTKVQSWNH